MPIIDIGINEYLSDLQSEVRALDGASLTVSNATEYAAYVQDLLGYFVIDEDHLVATVEATVRELVASSAPLTRESVLRALDQAGFKEVAYLRELTSDSTADGRRRHNGYWADETGQLASGYQHRAGYGVEVGHA